MLSRQRKLCSEQGCPKSAVGKTDKCVAHGGGKRCVEPGCTKGAEGKTDKCKAHGVGKRCIEHGCPKECSRQVLQVQSPRKR